MTAHRIWLRINHALVGQVLAEKHRRRLSPIGGEGFRVQGNAPGRVE